MVKRNSQYKIVILAAFIISTARQFFEFQSPIDGVVQFERSFVTEENLAANIQSCFETLEQFDLEQIPGISPRIAEDLYREKASILKSHKNGSTMSEAIKTIKGIGDKKAASISQNIRFCTSKKLP